MLEPHQPGQPRVSAGGMPPGRCPLSLLHSPVLLAARFLWPCDGNAASDEDAWHKAGRWFVLWGLLIGLAYAVIFRLAWRWFGEYQYIRWVPAAAVLAADLGLCGYRLLSATADTASRRDELSSSSTGVTLPAVVVVVLVAILKYAVLLSLPLGRVAPGSATGEWPAMTSWLTRFYPQAVYRPLILMPVWGRWGMMLALSIGRAAPSASGRLTKMAAGARLRIPLTVWVVVSALTTWYCGGRLVNAGYGLAIGLGMMTAAYLTAFVLARRAGGQNEATVGTVGLVCEMMFLSLYLLAASRIYWY